jgi:diguanylate cyclase (GGDEF)-like protein
METHHLLDSRTLLACESVLAVVFAASFLAIRRAFPQARGARSIAISFLLVVPDALAVGLRGHVSPVISVLIADTLMLASLIAMYEAVVAFTGVENRRWLLWFAAFVSFAVVYFYTDVHPAFAPRVIAIVLSMALVRGATAEALLRRAVSSPQRFTLAFFGVFMSALTGQSLFRAYRIFRFGAPPTSAQQDQVQSAILVTGIFYLATTGLCFLLLLGRQFLARRRMDTPVEAVPGMFNRRSMELNIAMELDRLRQRTAANDGEPPQVFSIALLEIDQLSRVAPTSAAGRRALREVAEVFSGTLRGTDHIGRFTERQFLLFLGKTSQDDAVNAAERHAGRVAHLDFGRGPGAVTLSGGIAEATATDTAETLIARAQRALKQAQDEGGDLCRLAPPGHSRPSGGDSNDITAVA